MPFQPKDFYFNVIQQEDDLFGSFNEQDFNDLVPSGSVMSSVEGETGMHGIQSLLDGEIGTNSNFQHGNSLWNDGNEENESLIEGLDLSDDFFDGIDVTSVSGGQKDALITIGSIASESTNMGMHVHGETRPDAMDSHSHRDSLSDTRRIEPEQPYPHQHQGNYSKQLANTFHNVATAVPLHTAHSWWDITPVMTTPNRCPFTVSEMRRAPRLARNSLFKLPASLLQALGQIVIRVGLFSTRFSRDGQAAASHNAYTVLIPEQRVALRHFSSQNTTKFGTQSGSHIASVQAVIDLIRKTAKKRDANYWLTLNGQLFFLICKFSKNRNKDIPIFKFLNIGQHGLITPNNNLHQQ